MVNYNYYMFCFFPNKNLFCCHHHSVLGERLCDAASLALIGSWLMVRNQTLNHPCIWTYAQMPSSCNAVKNTKMRETQRCVNLNMRKTKDATNPKMLETRRCTKPEDAENTKMQQTRKCWKPKDEKKHEDATSLKKLETRRCKSLHVGGPCMCFLFLKACSPVSWTTWKRWCFTEHLTIILLNWLGSLIWSFLFAVTSGFFLALFQSEPDNDWFEIFNGMESKLNWGSWKPTVPPEKMQRRCFTVGAPILFDCSHFRAPFKRKLDICGSNLKVTWLLKMSC